MEDRIWAAIVAALPAEAKRTGQTHSDRSVLMVGLWAVLWDRPNCWACREDAWQGRPLPPLTRPSESTISRRFWPLVAELGETLASRIAAVLPPEPLAAVDGKPLPVGGGSGDRDAKAGRAVGHKAKGYKLFAVIDRAGRVLAAEIGGLNRAEQTVAKRLYRRLPKTVLTVVGDGVYDSVPLHRVADESGVRHVSPLRENRVGRRQQPERLKLQALLATAEGQTLLEERDHIERRFGLMGNIGCGYKGLPNWVRREHRVNAWMRGKICIYHAWLALQATNTPQNAA